MNQPPSKRKKATSTTFSNLTPSNNPDNDTFDQDNPAKATITVNPLLSLLLENNLECLQHKTFTKKLDSSHFIRK